MGFNSGFKGLTQGLDVCAFINSFKGKLITCYVILSEHTEVIKHTNPAHETNSPFAGHSVSHMLVWYPNCTEPKVNL